MAARKGQGRNAFAICADGDRYLEYRSNVVSALRKYVPEADIVDIDPKKAAKKLKGVPSDGAPAFSRLAIPLMKELEGYDRIVWVDADTDVTSGDFAGILKVDTSDDGLAAAPDINQDMFIAYMKSRFIGYDKHVYFNSGVLVMDIGKIDKAKWRKKVNEALKEHAENPYRWPDQDILNGNFDIAAIDQRYNWIWRRGVDAVNGAWLVHYCDAGGRAALDEVIDVRNGIRGEKVSARDRCVAIAPRHRFVVPWIRAYFACGNTYPLVIVPNPTGDWEPGDMEYCRAAADFCGGVVLEGAEGRSGLHAMSSVARSVSPKEWAWISDDTEVCGGVDECFDYADRSPGFACVQFYIPDTIDNRHPAGMYIAKSVADVEPRPFASSFIVFHGEANDRLSNDIENIDSSYGCESGFGFLYENDVRWHEGLCDFSLRGWQVIVRRKDEMPQSVTSKAIHYATDEDASGALADEWAAKAGRLPKAPFEAGVKCSPECSVTECDNDDDAIDAVFVIGNGSVNGNEELRYALRDIAKHCKFVRDVYICGFCPGWVDKSAVKHLMWPDRFSHAKDANIIDKLRHACEQPGIAKRILFCSDDQFQTREVSWDDFEPRYLRRYASNDRWYEDRKRVWHSRLRNTLEREVQRRRSAGLDANDVFYFQPHMWMQIDRDKFIEYAKWSRYEERSDTIIASGYFNFAGIGGRPDFGHVFIGGNARGIPKETHVAYNDESYAAAMRMLKILFPDTCRFEVGFGNVEVMDAVPRFRIPDSSDPSSATSEEMAELLSVMAAVRDVPVWNHLLCEVSRAEELRLFGVRGWRTVWHDIVDRWTRATGKGAKHVKVDEPRGQAAARVVNAYLSNPDSMRTVRFGQAPYAFNRQQKAPGSIPKQKPVDRMSLHERVRSAARRRSI